MTTRRARPTGLWTWHRWFGLIAAAFLLLAAASGTLLTYKKPLVRWLVTDSAELPANYGPKDMPAELEHIFQLYPDAVGLRLKAPNNDEPYWTFTDSSGVSRLLRVRDLTFYKDEQGVLNIFAFVRQLHTDLFVGELGEVLYLVAGVAGIILTVSGVILWWPTKRMFRWRWIWPRPFRLSFILQYHRHAGALATPMLVILLVTGSLMLWQILVVPLMPPVATTTKALSPQHMPNSPSEALALAQQQIADGWPTYIRFHSVDGRSVNVRFRLPGEWHPNGRTSVIVDTKTAKLEVTSRSNEVSALRRVLNQVYPLHSGYGLNGIYLILVFVVGLFLTWLTVTGLVSYFRRIRAKI